VTNRNQTRILGELEALVMQTIWQRGEVSVPEVHEAVQVERSLAYTTILTTMRNLVRKGYLERQRAGRGHTYRAALDEGDVARSAVKELMQRLFRGSPVHFASALFEGRELSPEEFEKLRLQILEVRREDEER